MLDVLTLFVERIEESETTVIDWLSWNEKIKMITEFDSRTCLFAEDSIVEFDSRACLFVESSIDSMIDRFTDISFEISTRSDSSRFFLI
jgi:hypothetical protein